MSAELSADVLLVIATFTGPYEVPSISHVCQAWRGAITSNWKQVYDSAFVDANNQFICPVDTNIEDLFYRRIALLDDCDPERLKRKFDPYKYALRPYSEQYLEMIGKMKNIFEQAEASYSLHNAMAQACIKFGAPEHYKNTAEQILSLKQAIFMTYYCKDLDEDSATVEYVLEWFVNPYKCMEISTIVGDNILMYSAHCSTVIADYDVTLVNIKCSPRANQQSDSFRISNMDKIDDGIDKGTILTVVEMLIAWPTDCHIHQVAELAYRKTFEETLDSGEPPMKKAKN